MEKKRKLKISVILLLPWLFFTCSQKEAVPQEAAPGFIYRQGNQLILNNEPILLRGVCFSNFFWEQSQEYYQSHHSERDYEKLKNMNMNVIRFYMNASMFQAPLDPESYPEENFQWLDQNIEWARKHGIYLILDMHSPPGGYQSNAGGLELWENRDKQLRLLALWRHIAERYSEETIIAGYDILNEPVVSRSRAQWENLAEEIVQEIRSVDQNHLLIVANTMMVADRPWTFERRRNFFLVNDENVLYTFHFYHPIEYTHQNTSWTGFPEAGNYPDESKINLALMNPILRFVIKREREYLEYEVERLTDFGRRHNVPQYVGEFGAYKDCYNGRGGLQWLDDTLSLFHEYGLHYTLHSYHEPDFGIYTNYQGLPDPEHERGEVTQLLEEYLSE